MNVSLELQIEVTGSLYRFCRAQRCQKKRPELAAAAAEREIQFKRELDELEERRSAAAQQPELLPPPGEVLSAEEVLRRAKAVLAAKGGHEQAA